MPAARSFAFSARYRGGKNVITTLSMDLSSVSTDALLSHATMKVYECRRSRNQARARKLLHHHVSIPHQLGAQELFMALSVRDSLLRNRIHGDSVVAL